MKTRVIQDEPTPAESAPSVPPADEPAAEQRPGDPPRAPEQQTNGAKP